MRTYSKIGAAVAVALAAGAAQALPLSDYDATVVNVYYGGATATDNVLENVALAATGGYCVPGTIDIYRAATGPAQRVVFCRVNNTRVAGFPAGAGAKVAFHKESAGGSSNGVNPLIDVAFGQAHGLRWLDLDQLRVEAGNSCGAGVAAGGGALNTYTNHTACTALLTPVDLAGSANAAQARYDANGGISDVEPALSSPAPTASQIARLNSRAGLGIVFGVPVSTTLYRALQIAQNKTPNSDLPGDIPSLTSEQIRGIYSSNIVDWTQITDEAGTPLPTAPGVTGPAGGDSTVYICRRVDTSGTQASAEVYWLNQRCAGGVASFVAPNDGSGDPNVVIPANPANGNVNAGPGSGDVRNCLNAYGNTNGLWAIGVLSTEVTANNMSGGNFRMVAVDGAAPTLQNAANGTYDFWTENTLNRVAAGFTGAIPAGDLRLTLMQYLENNIGLPALISQLNTTFRDRPWGDGGSLAIPNGTTIVPNASPATQANMRTNPVNTGTRSPNGPVNNCSPSISTQPTPTQIITQTLP